MNSMTGFGRDAAQTDRYNILVEISGVNRKQTEIAVNVPRGYAEWDASVRSIVQGAVSRGRVGVSISVERLEEADGSLQLDEQKLASLAELLNRASDLTGQPLPLQASDLLRLDIVTSAAEASLSPEEAWPMVEKALKAALKDFISMRAAEGANLKADVLGKLDVLEQFRLRIAEHAPSVPVRLREAMLKRLADADLSVSADDERIIREVALFADKCDISEEITRLSSHFDQFRTLCGSSAPAGRPLDFLCQEIFREFNTIGSKANDSTLAHLVVAAEDQGTGSEHRMTAMKQPLGTLLVVSGPSGSGKTTLCRRATENGLCVYSISCTTRQPRPGEVNGVDYHFLTPAEFDARVERGDFLEYAEVHGNRYGTLKADILTLLEQGKNVVMDIDVQGAGQVRSCREGILPLCYADVYIYVPQEELKSRLCGRQTDGAETIALRLRNAEQEDACLPQYRYCLVSSDRETDYASFCALLKCQSMRVGLMR